MWVYPKANFQEYRGKELLVNKAYRWKAGLKKRALEAKEFLVLIENVKLFGNKVTIWNLSAGWSLQWMMRKW